MATIDEEYGCLGIDLVRLSLSQLNRFSRERILAMCSKDAAGNLHLIDNIRVVAQEHSLEFIGSLSTFHSGQNVKLIGPTHIPEALERLSDHIHYDIGTASVYRLDAAGTLFTDLPGFEYSTLIEGSGIYHMHRYEETPTRYGRSTRAKNAARQMKNPVFYDKGKEAQMDSYAIRLEQRFKKQVKRCLRLKLGHNERLRANHLEDKLIFQKMCLVWRNDFLRLLPNPVKDAREKERLTLSSALQGVASDYRDKYPQRVQQIFEEWKEGGKIDRATLKRVANTLEPKRNKLLQEVRDKIHTTYKETMDRYGIPAELMYE